MKKILIVGQQQYGYHTDSYIYCKKIKKNYDVSYLCFDEGFSKIEDDINVIYIKKNKHLALSLFFLNINIAKYNFIIKPDLIFSVYNPLNFISRILTLNTRMILDIRTGDVNKDKIKRDKANNRIRFNCLFFKEITIISEGLAKTLKLKKVKILPLGAKIEKDNKRKSYVDFNILYVGVLSNRNIGITVDAVKKFMNDYNNKVNIRYTIIGYFSNDKSFEAQEFFEKIRGIKFIEYLGRKKYDEIPKYFEENNIGISYIPITEYYDNQPPTKSFEYLANGMVTIATKTKENKKIITDNNGILCGETIEEVYSALETVFYKRNSYDTNKIKGSICSYDWDNIIQNIFIPIIENKL